MLCDVLTTGSSLDSVPSSAAVLFQVRTQCIVARIHCACLRIPSRCWDLFEADSTTTPPQLSSVCAVLLCLAQSLPWVRWCRHPPLVICLAHPIVIWVSVHHALSNRHVCCCAQGSRVPIDAVVRSLSRQSLPNRRLSCNA